MKQVHFSLFTYILFFILVSSSLVLTVVFFTNRFVMIHQFLLEQDQMFEGLTRASIREVECQFRHVEEIITQNYLRFQEGEGRTRASAEHLLEQTLKTHPSIFGAEIIYTRKKVYGKNPPDFKAVYGWRKEGKITVADRIDLELDYASDWFRLPTESRKPVWCDPYLDEQANVLMITFSVPVLDANGEVEAVLTADITLDWLEELLKELPLGQTGEPILFSADQTFLVYSNKAWLFKETLSSLAQKGPHSDRREFTLLSNALKTNTSGRINIRMPDTGEHVWCYYRSLPRTGVTIGCILPEKDILRTVAAINRWTPAIGILGMILLVVPAFFIAHSVSQPLTRLVGVTEHVAQGNFNEPLPKVKGGSEIARLVHSFNQMRIDLTGYIRDLTETTAIREKINAQLAVAHGIQLGMVPKNFDDFRQYGIDVYSQMEPAQEVGGDLYDFAMLDDDRFYFCIGDVSGKGIPASLFMAMGKTLLKSTIQLHNSPAAALKLVNRELMQYNDAGLFITAQCGIYYRKTGELILANAGHNLPVMISPDGSTNVLKVNPNLPLAILETLEYVDETFSFPPGSSLFLYTDGATDAIDIHDEFFGMDRLKDQVQKSESENVKAHVESIMTAIHHFAQGAVQSDDITIMEFKVQ